MFPFLVAYSDSVHPVTLSLHRSHLIKPRALLDLGSRVLDCTYLQLLIRLSSLACCAIQAHTVITEEELEPVAQRAGKECFTLR